MIDIDGIIVIIIDKYDIIIEIEWNRYDEVIDGDREIVDEVVDRDREIVIVDVVYQYGVDEVVGGSGNAEREVVGRNRKKKNRNRDIVVDGVVDGEGEGVID